MSVEELQLVQAVVKDAVSSLASQVATSAAKAPKPAAGWAKSGTRRNQHEMVRLPPPPLEPVRKPKALHDGSKITLQVLTTAGAAAFRLKASPEDDVGPMLEEAGRRTQLPVESLRLSHRGVVLEKGRRIRSYGLNAMEKDLSLTLHVKVSGFTFGRDGLNAPQNQTLRASKAPEEASPAEQQRGASRHSHSPTRSPKWIVNEEHRQLSVAQQRWHADHTGLPAPPHREQPPLWSEPDGWGGSARHERIAKEHEGSIKGSVAAVTRAQTLELMRQRRVAFGRTSGDWGPGPGGAPSSWAARPSALAAAPPRRRDEEFDRREAYGLGRSRARGSRPSSAPSHRRRVASGAPAHLRGAHARRRQPEGTRVEEEEGCAEEGREAGASEDVAELQAQLREAQKALQRVERALYPCLRTTLHLTLCAV